MPHDMSANDESVKKRQRLLDNDRTKYQQAVQAQMSKQSESISSLKKENEKLKQDVAATSGGSYDFAEQDKLANLQAESETLERKTQYERMRKNDIMKKLSMARMDVMRSRRTMGGVNITSENTQAVDKQVRVLENRLDQALVKFNEALAFNKSLREQIDNLREERKVFQRIYKKLESELHEKKKAMAEKIERANQDYEERDTLQQQLEALRQAAKEDQKKYEENFASIEAAMQQFKTVRDQQLQSMKAAAAASSTTKSDAKGGDGRGAQDSPNNTGGGAGGAGSGSQHSLHNKKSTQNLNHTQSEADIQQAEEETDLQEVVDQLKEATGIQDLDVLYHKFLKAEEHNFSMYNFVNELNTEQEMLEAEIAQLKEQLAGEKGDAQRRKVLKQLENELAQTEQQHERLQAETHRHKESLSVIRSVTQEVFHRVGCSLEAARELCGSSDCNELNLPTFLGLVEQRTNDILLAYHNAAQNEHRRRLQSKDEEARKRKERKQAERTARLEAGEHVPEDEGEGEDDEEDAAGGPEASAETSSKVKFPGIGPSVAHNTVSAAQLVRHTGLPNTNAGDAQADATDDVDEDNILSHEVLRQQMEQRLQQKREKDERGGRGKKKNDRGGDRKPGATK